MTRMTQQSIKIRIRGTVQGVGFRPAMVSLATRHGIVGTIKNTGSHVIIIAEATADCLTLFVADIPNHLPPHSIIDDLHIRDHALKNYQHFTIVSSHADTDAQGTTLPADSATCRRCLNECFAPDNRRFLYPFITCAHCGPRFTISQTTPFDRATTSYRDFPMCTPCQQEYDDCHNRRFHAETTSCSDCGPQLTLNGDGRHVWERTAAYLTTGKILAIKSLGGFQLVCNAHDHPAIARLRQRKNRPDQALAVMVRDLTTLKQHLSFTAAEAAVLSSAKAPIVLLQTIPAQLPMTAIAPDSPSIGVMLPTTALHHLLFRHCPNLDFLIVTSGNHHGAPLWIDDQAARNAAIADAILSHNRVIERRCDDSLVAIYRLDNSEHATQVHRRARGYAPSALHFDDGFEKPILACGGDLKNTLACGFDQSIVISPHIGDLNHPACADAFRDALESWPRMLAVSPAIVVVDSHPDYFSHRLGRLFAKTNQLPIIDVQHHHAHAAALMVANRLTEAVCLVFDGSGYAVGSDKHPEIWGGECFYANRAAGTEPFFKRIGHFAPSPLIGGDHATRQPWRQALARCWQANQPLPTMLENKRAQANQLKPLFEKHDTTVSSSAVGRLFDAVAALLGCAPDTIRYEGQAAIRLEALARQTTSFPRTALPYHLRKENGKRVIDASPLIAALCQETNQPIAMQAWRFHDTIARICIDLLQSAPSHNVICCGGVFQNRLLLERLQVHIHTFRKQVNPDIKLYLSGQVPINDGGIAAGQAAIAGWLQESR